MMKNLKSVIPIALPLLLLAGCSEDIRVAQEPLSFSAFDNAEQWASLNSLAEMQAACNIPAERLSEMSTDELVEACLNYPLFGNYLAYDDETEGIVAVMNGFNGFKELQRRGDACQRLIAAYENMPISPKAATRAGGTDHFSSLRVGYMELILGSNDVGALMTDGERSRLQRITDNRISLMLQDTAGISATRVRHTLSLSRGLQTHIDKGIHTRGNGTDDTMTIGYEEIMNIDTVIYTIYGKRIKALLTPETTKEEIAELDTYAVQTYPQATLLKSASATYNCHSYAWNMTDGGKPCWINATFSVENDNLSQYWSKDDYYAECSATEFPKKIHYYNSDHSAVFSSVSGMYESKWGRLPLMRHAPDYGPYSDMDKRKYYGIRYYEGRLESDRLDDLTPGESLNLSMTPRYYLESITYKWSVVNAKDTDVSNTLVSIKANGDSANITFLKQGIYYAHCDVYSKQTGQHLAQYEFEISVNY